MPAPVLGYKPLVHAALRGLRVRGWLRRDRTSSRLACGRATLPCLCGSLCLWEAPPGPRIPRGGGQAPRRLPPRPVPLLLGPRCSVRVHVVLLLVRRRRLALDDVRGPGEGGVSDIGPPMLLPIQVAGLLTVSQMKRARIEVDFRVVG